VFTAQVTGTGTIGTPGPAGAASGNNDPSGRQCASYYGAPGNDSTGFGHGGNGAGCSSAGNGAPGLLIFEFSLT